MAHDDLTDQITRLVTGLVDLEILTGKEFVYDGAALHADEVADLMLPSVMCIAQDVAGRLGMGDFGYTFAIGAPESVGFPLVMAQRAQAPKRFLEVAPFVAEVFDGKVMDCRDDLAKLFESAARVVRADFCLHKDTNYGDLI